MANNLGGLEWPCESDVSDEVIYRHWSTPSKGGHFFAFATWLHSFEVKLRAPRPTSTAGRNCGHGLGLMNQTSFTKIPHRKFV